jgi:putative transposase
MPYETIRRWCLKFGPDNARKLKRVRVGSATTGTWTEVFISNHGQQQYLWRAVDQDGDVIDIPRGRASISGSVVALVSVSEVG